MTVEALLAAGEVQPMRPWPRHLLTPEAWRAVADALRSDPEPVLLGLWADTAHVHALFMGSTPLIASVPVESGLYDALSPGRPVAALFERMIQDLWGHVAAHGVDSRPLLDHGRWPILRPLSRRPAPNSALPEPQAPGAVQPGQHQLSIGPIGGVAVDPVHLRVTAAGETAVRTGARLGYAHRGVLALMRGKPLRSAAPLAARIAADSTVAHAVAFARAGEAALDADPPPRGHALRGVMAELERIASHLADLGAMLPGLPGARCGALRETVLRASQAAFGHRLLMDCIVPGGTAVDLAPGGQVAVLEALDRIAAEWPGVLRGLDGMAEGLGVTAPDLVAQFAPGGVVGRAAGRQDDARRVPGYPPYHRLPVMPTMPYACDVEARLHLRLNEIRGSEALLRGWLADLPPGPVNAGVPFASGEGLGVAEGPHGDVWHWLRLDAGNVATNFVRDPRWMHWPLIEAACGGAAVSDLPLIMQSFSPAASGLEL
jgi:Ni,Fe-hydrogenase III large subunit